MFDIFLLVIYFSSQRQDYNNDFYDNTLVAKTGVLVLTPID